jgi:hypothetical protein
MLLIRRQEMALPGISHPTWRLLISKKVTYPFECLATQLILGRLALRYEHSPTEETMNAAIEELRSFFEKNGHLPQARADLEKIFGKGV